MSSHTTRGGPCTTTRTGPTALVATLAVAFVLGTFSAAALGRPAVDHAAPAHTPTLTERCTAPEPAFRPSPTKAGIPCGASEATDVPSIAVAAALLVAITVPVASIGYLRARMRRGEREMADIAPSVR